MTKAELAAETAAKTEFTPEQVENVLEAAFKTIMQANEQGKEIFIRGFGSFGLKHRKAKVARNIGKNEAIQLPAQIVPYFKPYQDFKDRVKKSNLEGLATHS